MRRAALGGELWQQRASHSIIHYSLFPPRLRGGQRLRAACSSALLTARGPRGPSTPDFLPGHCVNSRNPSLSLSVGPSGNQPCQPAKPASQASQWARQVIRNQRRRTNNGTPLKLWNSVFTCLYQITSTWRSRWNRNRNRNRDKNTTYIPSWWRCGKSLTHLLNIFWNNGE